MPLAGFVQQKKRPAPVPSFLGEQAVVSFLLSAYRKASQIKSIGVSNFMPHHLEALMKTKVLPMEIRLNTILAYAKKTVECCLCRSW